MNPSIMAKIIFIMYFLPVLKVRNMQYHCYNDFPTDLKSGTNKHDSENYTWSGVKNGLNHKKINTLFSTSKFVTLIVLSHMKFKSEQIDLSICICIRIREFFPTNRIKI